MNKQNVLNIVKEELETLHPLMQADAANPNPTYGSAGWMDIKNEKSAIWSFPDRTWSCFVVMKSVSESGLKRNPRTNMHMNLKEIIYEYQDDDDDDRPMTT